MKSLQTRAEALQRALEAEAAPEQLLGVKVVLCTTREEALAMAALPPVQPPAGPKIKLEASLTDFDQYMRERAPSPPPANSQ